MNYRWLPGVDQLVMQVEAQIAAGAADFAPLAGAARPALTAAARQAVAELRRELPAYESEAAVWEAARQKTRAHYLAAEQPGLRPVINATGVALHTNLGRAVLAEAAAQAVAQAARGYSNLELDLASGGRGRRDARLAALLCELTGAEDALVVNNNAAALLLALDSLARGREAVVSRGELVEIGGGFRIAEVMAKSGVRLVEVGATNRTHLADYAAAITAETALLVRIHQSNFKQLGFTAQVPREELVALAHARGLPVLDDLGSGCLFPLCEAGIGTEPLLDEAVKSGVDLLTCSGDKLLGGPQAGIILGRADLLAQLRQNPLARALRVDKFTVAALEATLQLYRGGRAAELPLIAMLTTPAAELQTRAEALAAHLRRLDPEAACYRLSLRPGLAAVGGGSLPAVELPTTLLYLLPQQGSAEALLARLRSGDPAVLAYLREGQAVFDPRCLLAAELEPLALAIATAAGAAQ